MEDEISKRIREIDLELRSLDSLLFTVSWRDYFEQAYPLEKEKEELLSKQKTVK